MPVSIEVDDTCGRIEVCARGAVSFQEAVAALAYRRKHDCLRHTVCVDCLELASAPTSDEVRALADQRRRLYHPDGVGPTVIVASDDLLYGMLRMYQILADHGPSLHIARSREDAEAWLADRAREG
jgi:hypothetical protein